MFLLEWKREMKIDNNGHFLLWYPNQLLELALFFMISYFYFLFFLTLLSLPLQMINSDRYKSNNDSNADLPINVETVDSYWLNNYNAIIWSYIFIFCFFTLFIQLSDRGTLEIFKTRTIIKQSIEIILIFRLFISYSSI